MQEKFHKCLEGMNVNSDKPQLVYYVGESNENLKHFLSHNLLNTKGT